MADNLTTLADYPNDLTGEAEHLRDSEGCGDPRRCSRHPNVVTSSPDGLHDAPCPMCEYECDMLGVFTVEDIPF